MKFILTFTLPPETRDEAIARFLETGGQPPPGVKLLGRWTQLDLCGGVTLLESEDPKALTAFAHGWSDLLELTMAPVLEDQDLAEVLRRAEEPPPALPAGRRRPRRGAEAPAERLVKADQTGEVIAVPPPPAVPGGVEGEGEEPEPPKTEA
jgi:uncharacterized protein DUF3303